jgi:hypothetical protein
VYITFYLPCFSCTAATLEYELRIGRVIEENDPSFSKLVGASDDNSINNVAAIAAAIRGGTASPICLKTESNDPKNSKLFGKL